MPNAGLTPDAEHAVIEAQVLGQADAAEIETREDGFTSAGANWLKFGAILEDVNELDGKTLVVEEVDEEAVFAMGDDLFDRRGARADDQAAEAHGLGERPRECERVSEVDVCR